MTADTTQRLDAAALLGLYEQMAVIRRTEKAAYDLFMAGLVKGTTHLAAGHEAVAVGASAALRPDDYVFATYRGHHHAMARGATPEECLAELMSKATGLCKAKGGSHAPDQGRGRDARLLRDRRARTCRWRSAPPGRPGCAARGQVAVAFFGDGATNIGAFHEALNLAAVWKLPVIFVCENNLYMEYTPIAAVTAVENPAADRAAAYRMPAESHRRQRRRAWCTRRCSTPYDGPGPATGRRSSRPRPTGTTGTAAPTRPSTARPRRSSSWLAHDPLTRHAGPARRRSGVGEDELARVDERAERTSLDAVREAARRPAADPAEAFTDVWADGGAAWRT